MLAAVLALMFGQRARETEREVAAGRVFAAVTGAMTRINPRTITLATE